MDISVIYKFFFNNWQRKLLALIGAIVIWLFVNNSITDTKTIPNVPIRITNLPQDKTIVGLLPNRLLSKRVPLTLSGTRDVIQELEPGDLEVLLDVSAAESDEWVVQITKKNLVSLNPSIDLTRAITQVEHPKFVLKLSPLVSAKIPIKVLAPIGEAPKGYEFLDVWPQNLIQTVSGAEEEIQMLKEKGLEILFNLNEISKEELDAIKASNSEDDEVTFFVPEKWKQVIVNSTSEEIDDPEEKNLRIDFLRKKLMAISNEVPVRVFYPLKISQTINASTRPLALNEWIKKKNEMTVLSMPLFVHDVGHFFLELVRPNLEITILASEQDNSVLNWTFDLVDAKKLEDRFVEFFISKNRIDPKEIKSREQLLKNRFQSYLKRLIPYESNEKKLELRPLLTPTSIEVKKEKV